MEAGCVALEELRSVSGISQIPFLDGYMDIDLLSIGDAARERQA